MLRRREVPKRDVLPDSRFGSAELTKFMNVLMIDGKEPVVERIVYSTLKRIEKKTGKAAIGVSNEAIADAKSIVEVKDRHVSGANYQVPVEVHPSRHLALAMRWVRDATHKRGEKSMDPRLADGLIGTSEGRGGTLKKCEEVYRMAEVNKAFSRFRFQF